MADTYTHAEMVALCDESREQPKELIRKAIRIARGQEGPQLCGVFDEDSRYNYPERIEAIIKTLNEALNL